jgi:hypothetical protein
MLTENGPQRGEAARLPEPICGNYPRTTGRTGPRGIFEDFAAWGAAPTETVTQTKGIWACQVQKRIGCCANATHERTGSHITSPHDRSICHTRTMDRRQQDRLAGGKEGWTSLRITCEAEMNGRYASAQIRNSGCLAGGRQVVANRA